MHFASREAVFLAAAGNSSLLKPASCVYNGATECFRGKYYPICGHYVIILYWRLLAGEPYALNAIYQDV